MVPFVAFSSLAEVGVFRQIPTSTPVPAAASIPAPSPMPFDVVSSLIIRYLVGLTVVAVAYIISTVVRDIWRTKYNKEGKHLRAEYGKRSFFALEFTTTSVSLLSAVAGGYLVWLCMRFALLVPLSGPTDLMLLGTVLTLGLLLDRVREFYTTTWAHRDTIAATTESILALLAGEVQHLIATSHSIRRNGIVRSNIMCYDPKSRNLKIEYRVHMDTDDDTDAKLTLLENEGAAGRAFVTCDDVYADLANVPPESFQMRPEVQVKVRKDLRWIYAWPLHMYHKDARAVVSVDSNVPISKSVALEVGLILEKHAQILSVLMQQVGIDERPSTKGQGRD